MDDVAKGGFPPISELWDAERLLWQAFTRGAEVNLRDAFPDPDASEATDRYARRRIRATVIAALLLGAVQPEDGYVPGASVIGARIIGDLDISRGIVECAVLLKDCHFEGQVLLVEAKTRTLDFSGSRFEFLNATAATINGNLIMDNCRGRVIMMHDAKIDRRLSLNGMHIEGQDGIAIFADRASVGGGMFGRLGFRAEGNIRLIDADLKGGLDLAGAHLANASGSALLGHRLKIAGTLRLGSGFRAEGQVALNGADISGQVILDGAILSNPGNIALDASNITTRGNLSCQDGFRAEGQVKINGAHIGGQVAFSGAHLINPGQTALNADAAVVENGMFLDSEFWAEGEVRIMLAHVGRELALMEAKLSNFDKNSLLGIGLVVEGSMVFGDGFRADGTIDLSGARISGGLSIRKATFAAPDAAAALNITRLQADSLRLQGTVLSGSVDVTSAQVRTLWDDPSRWPAHLAMDALTYSELQPYMPARGSGGRLTWLGRMSEYRAQPYEQLAAYYRRIGHDAEARLVLLARERRRRSMANLPGKAIGLILDLIVGYGYKPSRAFCWMAALLAIGSVYFTFNRPEPVSAGTQPHYQPVLYTADLIIPIVNLGQVGAWRLTGPEQWVAAMLILCGWILATAVVAGVTRTLTRPLASARQTGRRGTTVRPDLTLQRSR
jgi:hypothetical protein